MLFRSAKTPNIDRLLANYPHALIGASGIVFMMIILSAFTNVKKGEIPLSLLLVAAIYLGREIVSAFTPDSVSQFGHIMGGLFGLFWGIYYYKTKFSRQY